MKKNNNNKPTKPNSDDPVVIAGRDIPRGSGDWAGYDTVYTRLKWAAQLMSWNKKLSLSDEHVRLMAIMGCGHEETMKSEMHRLIDRGYIKF